MVDRLAGLPAGESATALRTAVAQLADAARRRRAVERLAERHKQAVQAHDQAVDQANIDELAVTSRARAAARGVDGLSERRERVMRHGINERGGAGA